jgi:hypothetical protein
MVRRQGRLLRGLRGDTVQMRRTGVRNIDRINPDKFESLIRDASARRTAPPYWCATRGLKPATCAISAHFFPAEAEFGRSVASNPHR